jgi:hypothetical protein
VDDWSLLFMLQKPVTSRACYNNEYRMDLKWFLRHLEFYGHSGNQGTDMRLLRYKLEVDTLNISFNLQQAVIRKICFCRPMFIKRASAGLCS